ncbi:MAG: hypothetical protein A4E28_01540 [Methanocella sp. PtaU1.Bin125]|nr:MAG: hypothetical protein A4E28_01540 [Methanocella sp. PtaU1.Bin125]
MPGPVMEAALRPGGHMVVVIGDVSGYPYHKRDLPLNDLLPETLAPAAAIALCTGLGLIGAIISASGVIAATRRRVRAFVSGCRNAHAAEASSESCSPAGGAGMNISGTWPEKTGFTLREIIALSVSCIVFGAFSCWPTGWYSTGRSSCYT